MKARVKATGEIVEIKSKVITSPVTGKSLLRYVNTKTGISYFEEELSFPKDLTNDPDYWTRLEHQAAIAAMGGICGNTTYNESSWESMAEDAILAARSLVEKMKEERK